MSRNFRVSAWLAPKLKEKGVAPAVVLERAGLAPGLFDQPRILVSTEEFFALWQAIGDVSRDPAIGLQLATEDRVERYDPIAIAALYTPTFAEALRRMARYKQLTCPEEIAIRRHRSECFVEFRWLQADTAEPAILIDLCFAWVLSIARRGTGTPLSPLRVELARPLAHRRVLERHFGCPVQFDASRNMLVFRAEDLDRPFVTHNPELLGMIAPQLEAELSLHQATFLDQVRAIIKRHLAGQRPCIQDVARDLHLSARTLQRRLTENDSSFQQCLAEARRELARHYLVHSGLELNETAYLLGYEDANSFVRAFHTWEGQPPAQWRAANRA